MSITAAQASAIPARPFSVRAAIKAALLWVLFSWIPQPWCAVLARSTKPARTWLWATRLRRTTIRTLLGWHGAGMVMILAALPANADTSAGVPTNVIFDWMDVKDSHGISVWKYFMSIDEGSSRHPAYIAYSIIINIEYEIYRAVTGSAIWFIGWALSFDWLPKLVFPVRTLGAALTSITDQFNLTTLFLTVTAAVVAMWIIRGRWSTGIYELLISCAIAALAVGVLSDPVERIAGTDGVIMQARDAGLQLAAGIANEGDTTARPEELLSDVKMSMADTFIRQPTQLMNFGRVLDGAPDGARCIEAWDKGHEDVPGNTRDTLKDNIKGCGGEGAKQMKDFADHPGPAQVFAGLVLIPGGAVVLLFGGLLAGALIMAACSALGSALKAIPGLVVGILPGAGRGSLWKTAATLVMMLTIMIFAIVFVVGYMIVVRTFFESSSDNLIQKFVFVDIVLIAGIVMFRRGINRLKKMSDTLASKLAQRPGAAPTVISKSTPSASPLQTMAHAGQVGRQVYRGAKTLAHSTGTATKLGATAVKGTAAATGTAATFGVAAAVLAARGAVNQIKKRRNPEPVHDSESAGSPDRAQAAGPDLKKKAQDQAARATGAVIATTGSNSAAPTSSRPRPSEVSKPGIKRPVSSAPIPLRPAGSQHVRASAGTAAVSPGGEKFREFRTSNGSPILLPEKPTRTPAAPSEVIRPERIVR